MIEVKIPSLGESISSGILAAWHVKDGDVVNAGQILYELETDKITSEGQAEKGGKISLKVPVGAEVAIGQVIATIDESVKNEAVKAVAKVAPISKFTSEVPKVVKGSSNIEKLVEKEELTESFENVSPSVRRIAVESGIKPSSVTGTGKGGRVTKGDMLEAGKEGVQKVQSTGQEKAYPKTSRTTRSKMSPLRKRIAQRLVAAQHEAAMLTTFNEVDMSAIMAMRKNYQDQFVEKHKVKLGFMSFFVKASVHALQEVPQVNASIDGDEIVTNHFYDIGIAVGGPKGLVVPVVRDCDQLSFAGIEKSIVEYAGKVKDGKLSIDEMMGGVFTITNGGIYGSMLSTPILNAPQSAILGMHAIKDRAVVVSGEIKVRPIMYLALSYDHRVVDGKEAVTFLKLIKESLEEPQRLLFEV